MTTIPTIQQLYADIKQDLESSFNFTFPVFGKLFLAGLAMVQAAKMKLYYLALAFVQKNVAPDTADSESMGGTLERFGRIKLNRNPFEARQGQYTATVTGISGAIIKAQTTFKSNDDTLNAGKLFVIDYQYTMPANTGTITIRALEAGIDSKMQNGEMLTATAPILGVERIITIVSETVQPLTAEDLEDYRQKVLDAYRLEPQGGAATDYRLWASDVQGVARVYPYAKTGFSNEINVFIEAEFINSIDGKGTPSNTMITDVRDVIEFDPDTTKPLYERGRRPLGVFDLHCIAITPLDVDVIINGFIGATPAIETEITSAIKTEIDKIRPFVSAADILENKNDILDVNKIIATILTARAGSTFGTIQLIVNSVSTSSYVFTNGNIPNLVNVIFV